MFVESFNLIRRIWADENFVHHGKYWTVVKNGPLSPPLVHRPHPPFLVSAQSEESQRWAAAHDIPFAQIDSLVERVGAIRRVNGTLPIEGRGIGWKNQPGFLKGVGASDSGI
jgi:alkanesulfonate monooxygenase SsuD/methylene tetrahydromethanopterin reductase-like flavin-dependent oxidoreductase (luciferase family)